MLTATQRLAKNLEASIEAKRILLSDASLLAAFEDAAQMVVNRYENGGRIYIAGNGGSAADSQHLAAEFVSRLARDRNPLPAEALTTDTSIITAIGNDYGYEQVFARQIAGKATAKDCFLGITTSGRSPNILKALEQCDAMGIPSIVFTGGDGGKAKALATHCIVAPGKLTSTIQEVHIVLAHTLWECVESAICGE
jgi:D-sedoheptulose 7-phosphate isomerase